MASDESPHADDITRAEGEGFAHEGLAQLVTAIESLRPGTRQLSAGQQAVLVEYEHIAEQLRPPRFSPPPPEISEFHVEGDRVRIFGKHLRGAITVTIAGVRAPDFAVREARRHESPYLEAVVPPQAGAGSIVVLTSGGSSISAHQFRAPEAGS